MNDNITNALVEHLLSLHAKPLSEQAKWQAKLCIIDYFGVACGGARENKAKVSSLHLSTQGAAPILGTQFKADEAIAAFFNGFHAHMLELDDGHRSGMIHLGATILSAVLAIAQAQNISGDDLLRGIVLGYEAAVRIARAIQPLHKKRGFHASGTCGTIGAAAGAAIALGADKDQLKRAISAAATSAAGLLEIQEEESELKPYNVAHAAMAAVMAAKVGLCGYGVPDDVLAGPRGFLRVMSDRFDPEILVASAQDYEIERIYRKCYAACRHCHTAIECALHLRKNVEIDRVQRIVVRVYDLAIQGHDHKAVRGSSSAKLSLPYCVAAAMVFGNVTPSVFEPDSLSDARIQRLMAAMDILPEAGYSECFPEKRMAEVEIHTVEGGIYRKSLSYTKGDPENPMTKREIEEKFHAIMPPEISMEQRDEWLRAVYAIDQDIEAVKTVLGTGGTRARMEESI